jgi:two-component system nitrate/nitrite response regulator NarL
MSVRCLVADDHPALVSAVADFLRDQGLDVLEPASDGLQALAAVEAERPDVALVDYRMPRSQGHELVARIKEISPDTRVAVYTADADAEVVADALAAGADAIVLKEAPLADLARALKTILEGRPYIDPALAVDVMSIGNGGAGARLTAREVDVLTLLAEGLSHEEIGSRLEIASETVRTHARKAAGRLGAKTRTQAVATAIRLGLIN